MPRKDKKAADTAKTSGTCTVAETEVTVPPQEERNEPPTPPIELVEKHLPPPLNLIQLWPCLSGALTIWPTTVLVQNP
ncbi:hypothetical protein DPMN_170246 [Dreissena polymorpha]|uniref:Uncharacterized protein n=1 Tax=Dreissena polymorpha TaxID=45954 RepID=A0A9D4DY76_DREPO|nr:hypothetical protein DPMN_170246 [Dreissena polymorpha]